MKTGKKQHTIPRFYLNQFIHPGWVYRRGFQQPRRVQSAKSEAVKEYYYSQDTDDENFSSDSINTGIETVCAPIFKQLLTTKDGLTAELKRAFSYFVANLALRVPAYIEEMGETTLEAFEQVDRMVERIVEKEGLKVEEGQPYVKYESGEGGSRTWTLEEWNKELESMREKVKAKKALITENLSLVEYLAPVITKMSWVIIDAPISEFFITSDRPVYLTNLDGSTFRAGWENTNALGTLPLSPRRYLVLSYVHPPNMWGYKQASSEDIKRLNMRAIASASYAIYSPKKYPPAESWLRNNSI